MSGGAFIFESVFVLSMASARVTKVISWVWFFAVSTRSTRWFLPFYKDGKSGTCKRQTPNDSELCNPLPLGG